jgi:hypothetical protein
MKSNSLGASAQTVSRLPAAYIKKPALKLVSKPKYKPGFRKLPFIAGWNSKAKAPYWNVPATGGYHGGYETGAAMAIAMLKFMREENSGFEPVITCSLPEVIESFMIRFVEEQGSEMLDRKSADRTESFASFRGQYCGFFNTLCNWLSAAAKSPGGENLDNVAEGLLVARANAGLGFDASAWIASLSDEV